MKSRIMLYLIAFTTLCMPIKSYPEEDGKVFVVLTTPDVQTQLMAMVLTTQMSRQGGVDQVLLCGPAGDLAIKGSEEVILRPIDTSPRILLKSLIKSGVEVHICPLYLPNKHMTADELIEGVTVATPSLIAKSLLEHGVKLFTF